MPASFEGVEVILFPPRESRTREERIAHASASADADTDADLSSPGDRVPSSEQGLEQQGFPNYVDYFRACRETDGDKVQLWITRSTSCFRALGEVLCGGPGSSVLELGCSFGDASAMLLARTAPTAGESENKEKQEEEDEEEEKEGKPFFAGFDNSYDCVEHCKKQFAGDHPGREVVFARVDALVEKRAIMERARRADFVAVDIGGDRSILTIVNLLPLLCANTRGGVVLVKAEELYDDAMDNAGPARALVAVELSRGVINHTGTTIPAAVLRDGAAWYDRTRLNTNIRAARAVSMRGAHEGDGQTGEGNGDETLVGNDGGPMQKALRRVHLGAATQLRELLASVGVAYGDQPFGHPLKVGLTPSVNAQGQAVCRYYNYTAVCVKGEQECDHSHGECHVCLGPAHRAVECDAFAVPDMETLRGNGT